MNYLPSIEKTRALEVPPSALADDPIAVLDSAILATVGWRSAYVRLSSETARKQFEHHPDLAPGDYFRIQCIVDHGSAILEKDRTLVFVAKDLLGKWWKVVVKSTADRHQTYLVTFHRIKHNQVAAAHRRGTVMRLPQGKNGARRCPKFPHAAEATGLGLGSGANECLRLLVPHSKPIVSSRRSIRHQRQGQEVRLRCRPLISTMLSMR